MAKVNVYGLDGKVVGQAELPRTFSTPHRPEVIARAVFAVQSKRRQPYGSDVLAGKRTSAHYHGRRHERFSMMNREMSRMPRIHGRSAGWMAWRARFAPHAVKGRRAHPPMASKVWEQKVNNKEHALAIRSALAACANAELLSSRGHAAKELFVVVDEFENLAKTKDVAALVENLGLAHEIERCKERKVRAGKGKMRGRRYKRKRGILIVTKSECKALKACRNIAGADAVELSKLNAELLAPGAQAGRLLLITKGALALVDDVFGYHEKKQRVVEQ
ncbi:MAG: 50S ribosomal protein L4 [Candidatus Aenigmatarchaeota archaeon]